MKIHPLTRFSGSLFLTWFAAMSGSLSVVFMLLGDFAGYKVAFSWAGWICIAVAGASMWWKVYQEKERAIAVNGTITKNRSQIMQIASLINGGRNLIGASANLEEVPDLWKEEARWHRAVRDFVTKEFPESIAGLYESEFTPLAEGLTDEQNIREKIVLLESLKSSISFGPIPATHS